MNVVSIPVQRISLHVKVVPREVPWGITQVVKLVPEDTGVTRGRRNNGHTNGQLHSGQLGLLGTGTLMNYTNVMLTSTRAER